jgi:hypothetical protein
MVTDEFSQMGVLVAMGKDQQRMDSFYKTVQAIKSTNGNLPSWRVYRSGDALEACKPGINGNCDTASDGTARIIIALFTASENQYFADAAKKGDYARLAKALADDMLRYEVETTCRPTPFGTVCHWLAGGSEVKKAGISASDFAYTGYYPDAIIAMLAAYADTGDVKYSAAAKDFTLNYLQAARFDGQAFSASPGKSFRWVVDGNGIPQAQCTDTCDPVVWDAYDASRALGMCQANYYAKQTGVELPRLQDYCDLLTAEHMGSATSVPLQFSPDGTALAAPQSGYFAQGLAALHFSGVDPVLFRSSLDCALSHYSPQTRTFDSAQSIGVYTQSFAIRALGMGIGRDLDAFRGASSPILSQLPPVVSQGIGSLPSSCVFGTASAAGTITSDVTGGACRTVVCSTPSGDIELFGCEKGGGYVELYRRSAPRGLAFKVCLADGCITKDSGFARFIPLVGAPVVPVSVAVVKGVASLSASCEYDGSLRCVKKTDSTSGACRTVLFGTAKGDLQVLACEKPGGFIEVYRQAYPDGTAFKACIGGGCVDGVSGFARV